MESLSVAIALASGEMASGTISAVESHPLLDLCGIARSVPDLLRLLERFRPAALLVSPSLLDEVEPSSLGDADITGLSTPISFVISHPGTDLDGERLAGMLRLPLKYAGLIAADGSSGEDLFREIKGKLDLFRHGDGRAAPSPPGERGRSGNSGLLTVTGCKGGVGATLVACALAAAVSSCGRRVLLLEMRRELSQLQYLVPRGEGKGALDLLPLAEEISWELIRVSVHRHAAGFYLLPYGHSAEKTPPADVSIPAVLLRNLLFLFDLVIQDFPGSSLKDFPPLLHHDPEVLLVSLPDSLTATCARSAATFLRRTGLDPGHLALLVNRCGPHHVLSPDELARAAGIDLLAALPDDAHSGLDFAELGELPHAESPLGKAAASVAAALGWYGSETAGMPVPRRFMKMRNRPGRHR